MTRILIADDHAVVRSGVRRILADHPNWSVVAEATDGKEAIAKTIATKPDVAIVDHALPLINGIEVTQQIRLRSQASRSSSSRCTTTKTCCAIWCRRERVAMC